MTQASGTNAHRNSPFTIIPHTIPASHLRDYPHAIANEEEDLFLEGKQYIPDLQICFDAGSGREDKQAKDDAVTIIAEGRLQNPSNMDGRSCEHGCQRCAKPGEFSMRPFLVGSFSRSLGNGKPSPERYGAADYGTRSFDGSQPTVSCR
jgi:hypothetical protein